MSLNRNKSYKDEMEAWIISELYRGTPVYIESQSLIKKFARQFFPEKYIRDKYGFTQLHDYEEIKKKVQKTLYSMAKKKIIEKKAMGVYRAKIDFLLGRNWVWAWRMANS